MKNSFEAKFKVRFHLNHDKCPETGRSHFMNWRIENMESRVVIQLRFGFVNLKRHPEILHRWIIANQTRKNLSSG